MKRILLLAFILLLPVCVTAQTSRSPQIQISTEKAKVGGKVYYIHQVMAKQTIYSICKAYKVTEAQLLEANPTLTKGLVAGSFILIPAESSAQAMQVDTPAQDGRNDSEAIEVETATGEEPVNDSEGFVVTKVIEHRVKWYETLSMIAKKYNVSADEILAYNGLEKSGISRGMILLIPVMGKGEAEVDSVEYNDINTKNGKKDGPDNEEDIVTHSPVKMRQFSASDPMRISLVLPFKISGGKGASNFVDFYCGALLAMNELKNAGSHVILNVFDLAQGASDIIASDKFQSSDVIVGPADLETMTAFLEYSEEYSIPLISPLDRKVDSIVTTTPTLFQYPVSKESQVASIAKSVAVSRGKTVLLYNSSSENAYVSKLEAALNEEGVSFRKIAYSSSAASQIASQSSKNSPVNVIVASEDSKRALPMLKSLESQAKRGTAMNTYISYHVFTYEDLDEDILFGVNAHICAPYFTDYSNSNTQNFVLKYRALFNSEPNQYSFQGYDVMTCIVTALAKYGTEFFNSADQFTASLLQSNVHFTRSNKESGWRNVATRNIICNKADNVISVSK